MTRTSSLFAATLLAALLAAPVAKADLAADVAEARARVPQVFRAVNDVVTHAEELDARSRAPGLPLTPRLRALGPNALFPMLEVLERGLPPMAPSARDALRVGLLEAVGSIRDARAVPVLERELARATTPSHVRGAATALARIGTDPALTVLARAELAAKKSDPERQRLILEGLHDCRREAAAKLLASRLAEPGVGDGLARVLVRSLGGVGNAWAWRASSDVTERDATRRIAATALLRAYLEREGEAREAAAKALLVVDDPGTPVDVGAARAAADADHRAMLDRLAERLAANPARLP